MIVGADAATDGDIVRRAAGLYDRFRLKRVYYSAFSPIPDASAVLPLQRPPLMREHRLYQSDWLIRFYDYRPDEVVAAADKATGMLTLDIDPTTHPAWTGGQQQLLDRGGRLTRFNKRFAEFVKK